MNPHYRIKVFLLFLLLPVSLFAFNAPDSNIVYVDTTSGHIDTLMSMKKYYLSQLRKSKVPEEQRIVYQNNLDIINTNFNNGVQN